MKKNKILLVSHVFYTNSGPVYGPVDVLKKYFDGKAKEYKVIVYSLDSKWPLVIKSIYEILNIIHKSILFKPSLFIGIDPLNALSGIILRKLGLVKKTVFYCVDYTPTRFKNIILNKIYLWIDKLCALGSDEVWNVSLRIVKLRQEQCILKEKIKYVPNSPKFSDCPRLPEKEINRNQIVMVTGQTHSLVMDLVLESFAKVSRKIPNLHLKIIGTEKTRSQKNVEFMGQLENAKLLEVVSQSRIALAIYVFSNKYSWIYYGDSKKTREYLACGIPVIITDVVGTSVDVEKYESGIVVRFNKDDLIKAIEKLIINKKFWKKCRTNAIKLGRDFDIIKILDKVLS